MLRKISAYAPRLLALVASLALISAAVLAQSQATSGNIEGRVLDPNEAAIPNVQVTATNQQTGLEKSVNTDDEGNYRIIFLPPGAYTVRTGGVQGFALGEYQNVQVTVGSKTPLDIKLSLSGTGTVAVDVSAEGQVVETTRTSVSSTINQKAIENLPINGRNYQDFATLTPGVVIDRTRGGDISVGGQKGTLNNLQVDGVDNNNTFFGQAFGRGGVRPPYQFSEESVQEFQVNQNGFSAEFGRAGGAVINVVTRSGTNEFHGGVFEYFRDESLNANDPAVKGQQARDFQAGRRLNNNKRSPSQINQFGGRIGGPIVKNRAFFFFTYDGQRQTLPNPLDVPNFFAQPASTQNLLLPKLGAYSIGRNQDVYLGKTDITLNKNNQLSIRFNQQNFTGQNNETTGALNTEEHSGNSVVHSTTLSGTLASTLSATVVNEFRFQFARDKEPGEANSTDPEALINTGGGNLAIGRNNFSPRETTIKRAQFIDNLSYVRGRSNFKFGVDFNFDRIFNFFPGLFSGSYTFSGITIPAGGGFPAATYANGYQAYAANFNTAAAPTATSYSQAFPGEGTSGGTTFPNSADYAAYAQDDWRATPKLTLNLGVRYDYQRLACPPVQNTDPLLLSNGLDTSRCPKDGNNFAPRVGFSYAFDEKTVLRGGYGIFYSRTTAIDLSTAHSNNGINVINVTLNAAQIRAAGLRFPNILSAVPTTSAPKNLYLFSDNYVQPYVQQARLGFEREVLPNLSLSITYMFFKGVHLTRTRDINLSPPTALVTTAPDGQTYTFERFSSTRPISRATGITYNRISLFESTANSRYNGLAVQATKRFSRGFQFIAAYTYSKAEDDKPDQTAVVVGADDSKIVQNQLNPRSDWGAADTDLRHRFVFSPVYEVGRYTRSSNPVLRALLSDYVFSGIVQLQSGFAYSAFIANDPNNDGNRSNDRLPGTERNSFHTPATYQFDARITRNIHTSERTTLRLILEGFNIFNRANVLTLNNTIYNFAGTSLTAPAVATPFQGTRSFLTPRQLQLAVKFDF
ncbi:MAG TPA: TonB-dependent receptor [Pyrinomonadaceae bacterium]|jgi:outer membrane receptor protein involved in Fe transport